MRFPDAKMLPPLGFFYPAELKSIVRESRTIGLKRPEIRGILALVGVFGGDKPASADPLFAGATGRSGWPR
jgi:hypothetical protein